MDEANRKGDELENIVKEAANKASYSFDAKAWSAMEQKLDAVGKVPFPWWKVLFPIGAGIIILLLLVWRKGENSSKELTLDGKTNKEVLVESAEQETQKGAISENTDQSADNNENDEVDSNKSTSPESEITQSEKSEESNLAKSESVTEGVTKNQSDLDNNEARSEGVVADETRKDFEEAKSRKTVDDQQPKTSVLESSDTKVTNSQEIIDRGSQSNEDGRPQMLFLNKDEFLIKKTENPHWVNEEINFEGTPLPLVRSDSFGVLPIEVEDTATYSGRAWNFFVSGDLSGARLTSLTTGTMIGVMRERQMGKNWGFLIGAAYSIKNYSALGSEYETPYWARNDPGAVESIIAKCIVLDIPINVRRYFTTKGGTNLFVGGGISSYWMLREEYDYTYNVDKPTWINSWTINSKNKHFFGVLNLSIGYQRPISDKLMLGIEPFAKLPIAGIGEGKVGLLSFGAKLSIQLKN